MICRKNELVKKYLKLKEERTSIAYEIKSIESNLSWLYYADKRRACEQIQKLRRKLAKLDAKSCYIQYELESRYSTNVGIKDNSYHIEF